MSTESTPRPEYGEYASAAEQAEAIERSGVPRAGLPSAEARSAGAARAGLPAASVENSPVARSASVPSTMPPTRTGTWALDRVVTIFLLSFGLVFVIGGAGTYLSLDASLESMFSQLGVGEYTPTSMTGIVGIIIVVSESIIWLLATGWSYARLNRGRLAWWIPVVAGVVSFIVSAILIGILLSTDPAFLAYATSA
jgi:Family of unknown function (DUF6264)